MKKIITNIIKQMEIAKKKITLFRKLEEYEMVYRYKNFIIQRAKRILELYKVKNV